MKNIAQLPAAIKPNILSGLGDDSSLGTPDSASLSGFCRHRGRFVSAACCSSCFTGNLSPRDQTLTGLTCAHRKNPNHQDCIAEQIATPERDGIGAQHCVTVCFAGRCEVDVFVRYRIVSVNGAPGYEVEEVRDDSTGESISLSDDEKREFEAHLIEGRSP